MTAAATLPAPYAPSQARGTARRQVEELICGMPGADPGELGFEFPWEIRAFAMAVAAHQALRFDWSRFQDALIASIEEWESRSASDETTPWSYYEHWIAALESVMTEHNLLLGEEINRKTQRILAEPANRNHHQAHTEPIAIDPAQLGKA